MKNVVSERYTLNTQNVDAISSEICKILSSYPHVSKKDILRTRLSAEEILLNWLSVARDLQVELMVEEKGRWLDLMLTLNGVSYPATDSERRTDPDPSVVDNMLANWGIDWIYQFHHGQNSAYISIEVKRSKNVEYVFSAIIFALITSALLRAIPGSAANIVRDNILLPFIEICSRFLTAVVSPMMLFGVIGGVLSVGSPRILNQMGKYVCGRFSVSMLVTIFISGLVGALFYPLQADYGSGGVITLLTDFLTSVVPENIVSPFIEGNMLQIVFLGTVIGMAMLFLQRRVKITTQIVDEANTILLKILTGFEKILPAFVYLSMLDTALSANVADLLKYINLAIIFLLFMAASTFIQLWWTSRRLNISFNTFRRKLRPVFLSQLASASSVAFTDAYDMCGKDFGVDKKLVSFALSVGSVIHKPFIAAEFVLVIMAACDVSGTVLDSGSMLNLLFLALLMSMAYPPVSGGEISCYTILLAQMGMSSGLLAIVCTISTLFDILEGPCNILCTELQILLLAKKHGFVSDKNSGDIDD